MDWTEVCIRIPAAVVDEAAAIANMVVPYGIYIEDYSDLEQGAREIARIDLIDEDLLAKERDTALIHLYISPEENPAEAIAFLRERYTAVGIDHAVDSNNVREEDWANNWKKYFKPLPVGEKSLICPSWETAENPDNRAVLSIDPGMAFGTGTHETTRLVIGLLEKHTKPNMRVLDVGCGSGILAICAAKLGAGECKAYDIDPVAVKVARENIKDSGLDNVTCDVSDLLHGVDRTGGAYDLICANIVADIIIRMTPDVGVHMHEDTILLASGIIVERSQDVIDTFEKNGFRIVEKSEENGWCALVVKKA